MRLPILGDFQATGWHVNDVNVGPLVKAMLAAQPNVFAKHGITKDIHIVHMLTARRTICWQFRL